LRNFNGCNKGGPETGRLFLWVLYAGYSSVAVWSSVRQLRTGELKSAPVPVKALSVHLSVLMKKCRIMPDDREKVPDNLKIVRSRPFPPDYARFRPIHHDWNQRKLIF
jgi:hypothetical protein